MDYCSGGSISTLLKAGVIEEKYSAVIAREVLVALIYIHKEGIIHRDIKAANVLVTHEGRVQLCDFGVAAQLSTSQIRRTSMIGTPYWMAPEVISQDGPGYNQKADIWSLGITVYEITTGHPPYADQDAKRAIQLIPRAKPARLEGTQYSPALKQFVAMCLDEQPEERASADELSRTKYIRNTKNVPTTIIKDLIVRYQAWRKNNNSRRDSVLNPGPGAATITDEEDDDDTDSVFWDFGDEDDDNNDGNGYSNNNFNNTADQDALKKATFYTPYTPSGSNTPTAGTLRTDEDSTMRPIPIDPPPGSHPLMDLFENEAMNSSTTNMNLGMPMPNFNSPSTISTSPPISIEIPYSLHLLDSSSHIKNSPTSSLAPSLSISTGSVSTATSSVPSPYKPLPPAQAVTPHTPIKPVFSHSNLTTLSTSSSSSSTPSSSTPSSSTSTAATRPVRSTTVSGNAMPAIETKPRSVSSPLRPTLDPIPAAVAARHGLDTPPVSSPRTDGRMGHAMATALEQQRMGLNASVLGRSISSHEVTVGRTYETTLRAVSSQEVPTASTISNSATNMSTSTAAAAAAAVLGAGTSTGMRPTMIAPTVSVNETVRPVSHTTTTTVVTPDTMHFQSSVKLQAPPRPKQPRFPAPKSFELNHGVLLDAGSHGKMKVVNELDRLLEVMVEGLEVVEAELVKGYT